ncbi:RIP metalloprotease RseP [Aquitalea palustris]|uniref:Zinc metalloprotease n=1 Tax=Aquitalea palustris TaxID=2480983 RepID=A0A454JIU1_9NEIS|nr:RIP metalloprotease RseP [Aquitalea palustris]RMC98482.1 RIP metalloprotease RseP [Aquitalea palustris]
MLTFIAFLVAIGVLVTFHELGHFWVARLCGVKVLRFSVGFGKPLFTVQRGDTEWAISPIPLGGYVRMLDEREMEVPAEERHLAFNNQHVLKRMAIVVAGPLANLLLAVLFYWAVIAGGMMQLSPQVGTVLTPSLAATAGFQAGDRVLSVNGQPVADWQQLRLALVDAAGSGDVPIRVQVKTPQATTQLRSIDPAQADEDALKALEQGNPGLMPMRYLPAIGGVEEGGVAAKAGLKAGDKLLSADGKPLASWDAWVKLIHESPGKELLIRIERDGKPQDVKLRPATVADGDVMIGRIGAAPLLDSAWMKQLSFMHKPSVAEAAVEALHKTGNTAWMSLKFLGRMVIGQASLDNLSGPLTIASIAGQTAREGWSPYLEFLALISVSIGVLNLLPIPVLDGGHLMYYVAELVKGRPLSERAQLFGQKIGFILLASLMLFAVLNDISRLFGG